MDDLAVAVHHGEGLGPDGDDRGDVLVGVLIGDAHAVAPTNAHAFADVLAETGVEDYWAIQPYRPRTNGKVERFNHTPGEDSPTHTSEAPTLTTTGRPRQHHRDNRQLPRHRNGG